MNALTRNGVKLDWLLACVGLSKNWLGVDDVLSDVHSDLLKALTQDDIGELYVVAEDKDSFLKRIESYTKNSSDKYRAGLLVWGYAFLNEVLTSKKQIPEKLKDIANVWAMIDYPEEWKSFIYYMPVADSEATGENIIYDKFLKYMSDERIKLEADDLIL